jgi:hypothetical protein
MAPGSAYEPLVDARLVVFSLIDFLAREKRLPSAPSHEARIDARRRLLAEQARALGVDLGETEPNREGGRC